MSAKRRRKKGTRGHQEIGRPHVPGAWLAEAAERELPEMLNRLARMRRRRKKWPGSWSMEDDSFMRELMSDIAAAMRFCDVRFEWTKGQTKSGVVVWDIREVSKCDKTRFRGG